LMMVVPSQFDDAELLTSDNDLPDTRFPCAVLLMSLPKLTRVGCIATQVPASTPP